MHCENDETKLRIYGNFALWRIGVESDLHSVEYFLCLQSFSDAERFLYRCVLHDQQVDQKRVAEAERDAASELQEKHPDVDVERITGHSTSSSSISPAGRNTRRARRRAGAAAAGGNVPELPQDAPIAMIEPPAADEQLRRQFEEGARYQLRRQRLHFQDQMQQLHALQGPAPPQFMPAQFQPPPPPPVNNLFGLAPLLPFPQMPQQQPVFAIPHVAMQQPFVQPYVPIPAPFVAPPPPPNAAPIGAPNNDADVAAPGGYRARLRANRAQRHQHRP